MSRRGRSARRSHSRLPGARIGLVVVMILGIAACSSAPTATAPDRTRGLELEVFVERGGDSYARYLLTEDGVLHFGGGSDALQEQYTWSGSMTPEEINRLHELLAEADWFRRAPPSTGRPPPRYRIDLERQGTGRRLEVRGESLLVDPIVNLLETAARRRHEDILRQLPRPVGVEE